MSKTVLIVGTGLGGLSTGLRLAVRGYKVKFVEKNKQPGGRLNQLKKDGFTFDIGPSFFSMPYEFEELVNDCNIKMPFEFVELDPLYTVTFQGNSKKFYLYKDIDKLSKQFTGIEPNFKEKFISYLKNCEKIYNNTVEDVTKRNFDNLRSYLMTILSLSPANLPLIFKTFWKQSGSYFKSKEAKQIVSLIAFFLGRTPFDTMAVYTLLSHVEFTHTGYYNVKGGMYTIVSSLINELQKWNVQFNYDTEIINFTSLTNKVTSLIDQNGKNWKADIFIINSDAALFRGSVLKRKEFADKRLKKMSWTMGFLTFYVGVKVKLPQVEHHNYFLGNNFEDYSRKVIKNPGTLEKPYYYVNVVSKHNNNCAPKGCEALFFVCPVPNLLYKQTWSDTKDIVNSIISDFSRRIDQDISKDIIFQMEYTPEDWQNQFNLYKGAGLGLSHNMMQIGALRPKNYDEKFKNIFYVGASTIPGSGLPMVVISSKLVTERILKYE